MSERIIEKLCKLACLELSEKEKEKFEKELNKVLDAFNIIDEIEVSTEPAFRPIEEKNKLREDVANATHEFTELKILKAPKTIE